MPQGYGRSGRTRSRAGSYRTIVVKIIVAVLFANDPVPPICGVLWRKFGTRRARIIVGRRERMSDAELICRRGIAQDDRSANGDGKCVAG